MSTYEGDRAGSPFPDTRNSSRQECLELGEELCSQCASLNLSQHKFTARTTLTATTRTNTTTVVPGEFDSIGFDPTHLDTLDQIYCRSIRALVTMDWMQRESKCRAVSSGTSTRGTPIQDLPRADSSFFNEHGSFPEFYVVPAALSTLPSPSKYTVPVGRIMDSNAADMDLLTTWLESCQSNHPDCSNHQKANLVPLTTDIRLIDVFDMCIRTVAPGESPIYASLSYVWGGAQSMSLKNSNRDVLRGPGSLNGVGSGIPLTVLNAIEAVRQLGIPYIWVDALCIVQDDGDDMRQQIQIMDKIYQHAVLTICVAAGSSSQSGIPGVGGTAKGQPQQRGMYKDLQLAAMRPVAGLIRDSRWDSCAWTFQERLLSTRCAIFTDAGLVWQCSTTTWREDMASPLIRTLWSLDSVGSPLRALMGNPLRSYSSCVNIYSSRKLTVLSDKLKAFDGLGAGLGRKLDSQLVFGLPSRYFDWALLWEAEDVGERIRRYDRGNECLPSWSWCGWDQQVDWRLSTVGGPLFNLHEWLTEHTWIIWRIATGQSWELLHNSCETACATTSQEHTYQSKRWDGYGYSITNPYGRSEVAARCRHFDKVPLEDTGIDCLPAPEIPTDGQLLFKTFTGFFSLSRKSMSSSSFQSTLAPGLCRFGITDNSGDWCGSIILDKSWKNSVGAVFEFAALSDAKEFTLEELDTWTYYIPEERQQAEWYCFYALMLKWDVDHKGNSVAERVGLAKIFQYSFFGRSFKPCVWKRIVLA